MGWPSTQERATSNRTRHILKPWSADHSPRHAKSLEEAHAKSLEEAHNKIAAEKPHASGFAVTVAGTAISVLEVAKEEAWQMPHDRRIPSIILVLC
jgi:tRNA(Ile)-lysidine synthase TilS/MesJ